MRSSLMLKWALLVGVACTVGWSSPIAQAQVGDCGGLDRPIVFGDLDWESAQVANWVARIILETGFGCTTDAVPGSIVPIYLGAIRGDVDVIMEVWTDNSPPQWTKAVADGTVAQAGIAFDDAVQGWFVPRYLVEGDADRDIAPTAPDLEGVFDLPEHAALFRDPERPDLGRFYNCVIGWQCELVNTVKLHAYGLDDTFTNFRSGTGAALAAELEGAYRRGDAWLGYYWGPTWVLGAFDLYQLSEPPFTQECWDEFTALLETPEAATAACAYPTSTAVVALGSTFMGDAPDAVRQFLQDFHGSTALFSRALAYMHDTDAEPRAAAIELLRTERETWSAWVPPEVAAQVAEALNGL